LAKLPGEDLPQSEPESLLLEKGHSEFLESLLGNPNSSEPAILPAPGQFSLVGCIAESAAAVDSGGPPVTAGAEAADMRAAPKGGMDGGSPGKVLQEVRMVKLGLFLISNIGEHEFPAYTLPL
jgi:hypothetical protein